MRNLTLLVGSGWDRRGLRQRAGDQHLAVEVYHGMAGGAVPEDALQVIRRAEPGVVGDVDVNLTKEEAEPSDYLTLPKENIRGFLRNSVRPVNSPSPTAPLSVLSPCFTPKTLLIYFPC